MAGLDDAASELESIARHLRRAGETDLVRELTAAMRKAVEPVQDQIRHGLRTRMPDQYADVLNADLNLRVSVITSDRNPGVTLSAQAAGISGAGRRTTGRRRLRRLNGGVLEHPLFGDKGHWYKQSVEPGFFSGPARDASPRVRQEIEQALEDVAAKAASKGA